MPAIANDCIEEVRSRADLAQVMERSGVELRRKGRVLVGRCPFHDDHKPSLQVDPAAGRWKCWVCDVGGDVFAWVQQRDGLSFVEAVERLAAECGVELRRVGREVNEKEKAAEKAADAARREVWRWAEAVRHLLADYLHRCLTAPENREALDYLIEVRGRRRAVMSTYKVGLVRGDSDGGLGYVREALREKATRAVLVASGMFRPRRWGQFRGGVSDSPAEDLVPELVGYVFPQFGRSVACPLTGRNRPAVVCFSRKPVPPDTEKYQAVARVWVKLPGLSEPVEVARDTDGGRPVERWLQPRELAAKRLILVEGEHDLLAVAEGIRASGKDGGLAGWSVAGIRGTPSAAQVEELVRARAVPGRETVLAFDRDRAGWWYCLRLGAAIISAGGRARVIDWKAFEEEK